MHVYLRVPPIELADSRRCIQGQVHCPYLFCAAFHLLPIYTAQETVSNKNLSDMAPALIESEHLQHEVSNLSLKDQNGHSSDSTTSYATNGPMKATGVLDKYDSFDLTPVIGREFPTANLVDWLQSPDADELLRELAYTSACLPKHIRVSQANDE